VISILIFWYARSSQDYRQKREIINTCANASDYVLFMQNGKVIEKGGANYLVLDLVPNKGDIIIGKE